MTTTRVDDLIARIRAAIDEDERVANAAAKYGPTWSYSESGIYPSDESRHPGPIISGTYGDLDQEYGEHIARHDPNSVLRQVTAHRKILDIHKRHPNPYNRSESACQSCDEMRYEAWFSEDQGCPTIQALAEAYGIDTPAA